VGGKRFWLPLITCLAATPICLLLGFASGGAGHGDYVIARILFPFTMLAAVLLGSITAPFVLLAVAQFPIYGLVLGAANKKGRMALAPAVLVATHVIFAVGCFIAPGESIS
jgi:hypothetical protein